MFKRIFWLSALLAVSAFAGQVVIKSGILNRQGVAVAGESTYDRLTNAASQTTQELWNSTRSFIKAASFLLPDALIQSLSAELPAHDPSVGSTPGQGGVSGGSASYSIPIALPPGRKGMQPNISLSYSSKGGNGIAGMGWNISGLSSLHRCPQTLEQDGQIRAVDYSMNDRLCFDGQRLVATSGTYGALNTKYATEIDSFARITQLGGDLNAVNSYFKVEYKSGEIAYFGGTSTAANNSRVIAGGVTKPLNWLIARSEDRLGNNIVYTYTNFTNGEIQPAAIFYTGFNTTQGDRKVEFIYETRPSTAGANDQGSSYLAGGLTRQTKRLTTVKTWVGTEAVREYRLNYGALSASSGRSLLRSVQECAMLGATATCRRPISFNWQEKAPDYKFSRIQLGALESDMVESDPYRQGAMTAWGDLNGDGAQEYLYTKLIQGGQELYLLNLTPERTVENVIPVTQALAVGLQSTSRVVDFDNDGKSDLVTVDANRQLIVNFWDGPANAQTFTSAFTRQWNSGVYLAGTNSTLGAYTIASGTSPLVTISDMDGDGHTDIVTVNDNPSGNNSCKFKLKVFKNNPNAIPGQSPVFSLLSETCLAATSYESMPGINHYDWWFEDVAYIEDLNGDGLKDFVLKNHVYGATIEQQSPRVLLSQRNPNFGFTSVTFASLFPTSDPLTNSEKNPGGLRFWMDVNGDGLSDIVSGTGRWALRINNGKGFGARVLLNNNNGIEYDFYNGGPSSSYPNSYYEGKIHAADIDSDGRSEILIPRRFAQRLCGTFLTSNGGGVEQGVKPGILRTKATPINQENIYCPEEPTTGLSLTGGTIGAELIFDTGTEIIPSGSLNMYRSGFGYGDMSAYYMNSLRIIESAPGVFSMVEQETSIIEGANQNWQTLQTNFAEDIYGDGLSDSISNVSCRDGNDLFYCLRPIALSNGTPLTEQQSPSTLPNNIPLRSKGVYINENQGTGLSSNGKTPKSHDTLASVTDGLGNTTSWTYYPLGSKAGRDQPGDTPLYTLPSNPAQRYVDARHTYFTSSMQVVSEMTQSNGIGGENKTRYSYSEAMYNTQGRGFQGFRKIIEEDMTGGLRTTTTFSQKYPLTSRVEKVVVNPLSQPGESHRISQTDNIWRCNRLNRNDTAACNITPGVNPVRFVYQSFTEHVTFDLNTAIAGLPYKLTGFTADYYADTTACDGGTISSVSGYDAYGNVTAKTHFVSDYSDGTPGFKNYIALSCNRTRNTYATADTTNWWLDKLTNTESRNEILHGADQPLPGGASNPVYITNTAYTWNLNFQGRTLATETFQNGIANQQKVTTYAYPGTNNYGLPLSVTVTASGDQNAGGRTTSTTYSPDGYFPLSVTNALGHTATTVVRLRDGLPISVTDPNGLRTLTTYDAFSQATLVKARGTLDSQYLAPDKQVAATWCTVTSSSNSCGLSNAAYQLTSVQDGSPTSVSTHDKLGRVLRTQSKLVDGTTSFADTQYNNKGQTIAQSLPYRSGDTPLWTYFVSYDILGRLTAKTTPQQHATRGDMVTTYTYNGRTTAIQVCGTLDTSTSNCLNLSRTTDSTGRYVETTDALGGITKFWFDANGQAAVLQDVKGSQIKATYNAIGQRTNVNDPNQGISNFTYNALGEVLTQTDARGITSATTYDKLGRKTQFNVTADANGDGTNDAIVDTWTYDPSGAKGQLAQSKRTINGVTERQENSVFDALIRPSQVTAVQNTGGGTTRNYSSEFQYDSYYGRVLAQFFPNGEGEQFIFNQYGYETEQRSAVNASIYRQIVSVDAAGRPTRELKGFNLATDTTYWPNGQTKSIVHKKDGITIRKIDYAYDVFGNVATQELNNGMAGNTLEKFSYDNLHRLTESVRTGAATATVSYGYDAAGNFNFKSDFSASPSSNPPVPVAYNLQSGGLGGGGANAVKSVLLKDGGERKYGYDASGNMTADNTGFAAIYDHANLATKLQRGAVINVFTYGPNNAKARQTGSDGNKVYLGGYEDWITAGQTKVSLGNYAQITNGTGGRVLHYFLTDRLGSVDAVTDGNGNLIETRGYDAFGAPRTGVWGDASLIASTAITPKGFTSHEHLNNVQLIHMNGRMYDFQLGRFLSVDPFIQAPTNSQSMNPYSYIMNSPLSGTDPTGYSVTCTAGDPDCTGAEPAATETKEEKPRESASDKRWKMACSGGGCQSSAKAGGNGVAKFGSAKENGANQQTSKGSASLADTGASISSANAPLQGDDPNAVDSNVLAPLSVLRELTPDENSRFDYSKLAATTDPVTGLKLISGVINVSGTARNYAAENLGNVINKEGAGWKISIQFQTVETGGDLNFDWSRPSDGDAHTGNIGTTKNYGGKSVILRELATNSRSLVSRGLSRDLAARTVAYMRSVPAHEFITHGFGMMHTKGITQNITSYSESRRITDSDFAKMYERIEGAKNETP